MNPSSIYKNQIKSKMSASKSTKSTIHVKDIHKLTPIPTAIKLKTPEPLKSHQECSIFEYPILDIVNTNFNLKMKSFENLFSQSNILHSESKFIFACLNIAILEKVSNS